MVFRVRVKVRVRVMVRVRIRVRFRLRVRVRPFSRSREVRFCTRPVWSFAIFCGSLRYLVIPLICHINPS